MSVNRNILDALRDVHEGMLTSMRHNKKMSKDGEKWLKAIMSGDSSHIPMNNVDTFRIFNKSKLNTNASQHRSGAVLSRSLSGSIYSYVYLHVYKVGSTSYIAFIFSTNTASEFSRALIHEADNDTIAELVLDFNSGKLKADKPNFVDSFKGCTLVASTYYNTIDAKYYMGLDDFLDDFLLDCSLKVKYKCGTFEKDIELYPIINSTLSYDASIYEFSFNLYTRKGDKDGISALYNYLDYSLSSNIMYISKEDNAFVKISFYL